MMEMRNMPGISCGIIDATNEKSRRKGKQVSQVEKGYSQLISKY